MRLQKKATLAIALGLSVFTLPGTAMAFNGAFAPKQIGAQLVYAAEYTMVQGYRDGSDNLEKQREDRRNRAEDRSTYTEDLREDNGAVVPEGRHNLDHRREKIISRRDSEARWQAMPPEVKEKIRQKIEDRFGHLTPEQRAEKLEELRRRREELRRELESLPPAERKARMEELKEQFRQNNKDSIH